MLQLRKERRKLSAQKLVTWKNMRSLIKKLVKFSEQIRKHRAKACKTHWKNLQCRREKIQTWKSQPTESKKPGKEQLSKAREDKQCSKRKESEVK